MNVHPDKTAIRAVDACGGSYGAAELNSRFAEGHSAALCEAMKAVVDSDALTAELLEALQWAMRQIDESHIETEAAKARYDAGHAVIRKATGAA